MTIHHALVNSRVLPGLSDDQIGPLHDEDGHKETGVAGVLNHLMLSIGLQASTSITIIIGATHN